MPRYLPCTRCGNPSSDGNLRRGLCKNCDATARLKVGYEPSYIDAQPAREHVIALRAAGMGLRRIEALTGVSRTILTTLTTGRTRSGVKEGPSHRIARHNAERILALPLPDPHQLHHALAPGARVPAIGTVRRMQALIAYGYTAAHLARELGWLPSNCRYLYSDSTAQVTAETARAVDALFSRLQMVPPPAHHGREWAQRRGAKNGWKLPLFWDEDSIDAELVDDHYVQDARADRRKKLHFAIAYTELRELGYRDDDIARRMGVQMESLQRQKERHAKTIEQINAIEEARAV